MFPVLTKLQEMLIVGAVISVTAYFVIIKPHYDLKDAEAELIKKDKEIAVIHHDTDKEVFETKYTEIKKVLKTIKVNHEKDINLSVGIHTIIFD